MIVHCPGDSGVEALCGGQEKRAIGSNDNKTLQHHCRRRIALPQGGDVRRQRRQLIWPSDSSFCSLINRLSGDMSEAPAVTSTSS